MKLGDKIVSIGFRCPFCGGRMRVCDSRDVVVKDVQAIRRRRYCVDCEERIQTIEIPRSMYEDIVKLQSELEYVRARIRRIASSG